MKTLQGIDKNKVVTATDKYFWGLAYSLHNKFDIMAIIKTELYTLGDIDEVNVYLALEKPHKNFDLALNYAFKEAQKYKTLFKDKEEVNIHVLAFKGMGGFTVVRKSKLKRFMIRLKRIFGI